MARRIEEIIERGMFENEEEFLKGVIKEMVRKYEIQELNKKRVNFAREMANIAKEIGVRGMDAIVVQIAKEFGSILISLDGEMVKRAKSVVTVKNVGDL